MPGSNYQPDPQEIEMTATVDSSGSAAPHAHAHNNSGPGTTSHQVDDANANSGQSRLSALYEGAASLRTLLNELIAIEEKTGCRAGDGVDTVDHAAIAQAVSNSIRRNLTDAVGPHREGFLAALSGTLSSSAHGFAPGDGHDFIREVFKVGETTGAGSIDRQLTDERQVSS